MTRETGRIAAAGSGGLLFSVDHGKPRSMDGSSLHNFRPLILRIDKGHPVLLLLRTQQSPIGDAKRAGLTWKVKQPINKLFRRTVHSIFELCVHGPKRLLSLKQLPN